MSKELNTQSRLLLEYFDSMLNSSMAPSLPQELEGIAELESMHEKLSVLRHALADFAKGQLDSHITVRGYAAGALKSLQANLRHLTWQVQQVEKGDFTQRVYFLGDFSKAFNSMVEQLDDTMSRLQAKENSLTRLTESLQEEVEKRSAAVYALKQSEAKFKYLAEHDPLTNILNRRSFYELAMAELQSAAIHKKTACIALLDIDHFKVFNDSYGHLEGDAALRFVVSTAQGYLRKRDLLGRFGGEEFIFYFSGVSVEQSKAIANRIRIAIEKAGARLSCGKRVDLTVSIGIACGLPEWFKDNGANMLLQYLIAQADDALYTAKRSGRNCVCLAETLEPDFLQE